MKLGFILYGITRDQAHLTAPAFYDLIVNPLRDFFEVKTFLHAFILNECQIDWHSNTKQKKIKTPHDYNFYKADYISFTDQQLWSESFDYQPFIEHAAPPSPSSDYVSAKNYINALHSLSESFKHTSKYPCDLYFISRLDLLYQNFEGVKEACLDISKNLSKNIFYSLSWGQNLGLNDRIAISNSETSKLYCNRFDDYLRYKEIRLGPHQKLCGLNIHPESMLKRFSEYNNLINKFFNCRADRIRVDGSIVVG